MIGSSVCESMYELLFFFARIGRSDLTKKLEKVWPFECDELEKHYRVSAKCYPTTIPALYTVTKETFKKSSMLPEITLFLLFFFWRRNLIRSDKKVIITQDVSKSNEIYKIYKLMQRSELKNQRRRFRFSSERL